MVDLAKKAGADVIKFQHHLPDEEMLKSVPKSKNFTISLYDFLKKYSLKIQDHYEIKKYCFKKKIKYLCTPFSLKAAHELNEIGVEWFKVGSGDSDIVKFFVISEIALRIFFSSANFHNFIRFFALSVVDKVFEII